MCASRRTTALAADFTLERVERFPYFSRYVVRFLAEHPKRDAIARVMFDEEQRLIAAGAIVPVGLRVVGRRG